MTYIVKEGKEMKIITVRADQEVYFQAGYAGRILASGNNTMEALMKFGELPQLPDQDEDESPE
jgi:hypothetical protein